MLINIQITVLLYILLLRFSLLYMVKKRQFFIESCMSAGKRDYIQHMVIMLHYIGLYAVHILSLLPKFMLRPIVFSLYCYSCCIYFCRIFVCVLSIYCVYILSLCSNSMHVCVCVHIVKIFLFKHEVDLGSVDTGIIKASRESIPSSHTG